MSRFWNWTSLNSENSGEGEGRTLHLEGVIAPETWFDDEITPAFFKEELNADTGPITVWINSPGGDCVAAAQIYNLLTEYPHPVTVKIDGIAASAASVIAMAGDTVLMSPVSTMMIHNPATIAMGDHTDMEKAIQMLGAVKDSMRRRSRITPNTSTITRTGRWRAFLPTRVSVARQLQSANSSTS